MIEGHFVVLEGVDGAGTTTHTKLLADRLQQRSLPVHTTREPSDGPVGVLLRQILRGRVVVQGVHGVRTPSWGTMTLLFAADRLDHIESEIQPNLMDGVTVISDRYDYSSVAYQSLTSGSVDSAAWIREVNAHARRPELTIVLDIPPGVAARRRLSRTAGREIFDDEALQRQIADFYRTMDAHFPEDKIVHINADRPVGDVAAEVYECVRTMRGE